MQSVWYEGRPALRTLLIPAPRAPARVIRAWSEQVFQLSIDPELEAFKAGRGARLPAPVR